MSSLFSICEQKKTPRLCSRGENLTMATSEIFLVVQLPMVG
jgi:hypothetical protein